MIHHSYMIRLFPQTTDPHIAALTIQQCHTVGHGHHQHEECTEHSGRYTYAIPLEIIYMTPLYQWNPYDLNYIGMALCRSIVHFY